MRWLGLGLLHQAMTAFVQIILADTDVNVLATLSVGVVVALVWSSVQEFEKPAEGAAGSKANAASAWRNCSAQS
jgi:hypothetical protein